jgi:hypothetical protein
MAASSARVGLAMDLMGGKSGSDAVGFGDGVVDKECLEADTRLSRASAPKTAGPRLRS